MALLPITTAAALNPVVEEMDRVAAQLSAEISAQQQAVVPASPVVPTPDDVPDNAISVISGVMAGNVGAGDTALVTTRPELAAAIERDQDVVGSITADLRASLELSGAQADILSEAILSGAAADRTIVLQRDNVDMKAQNSTIRANRAAGGVERQTALMSQLREQGKNVDTLLEEKADIIDDEITGIQLIDGVINSFRSFQTDLEILAGKDQEQHTASQIQAITSSTTAIQTATQATKETINEGTIAANQDKITAVASIDQVKAQISMVQSNAGIMQSLLSASRAQVANAVAVAQLENTDENQILARERLDLTRQQMAEQRLLNDQRFRAGELSIAREQIQLAIEEQLPGTEVTIRRQQLTNLQAAGTAQALALKEKVITFDARVGEIQTRSDTASVQLQQAEASLDQFIGTDEAVRERLTIAVQQAQTTLDATTFDLGVARKNQPLIEAQRNINLLLSNQQLTAAERANLAGAATTAGAVQATIAQNKAQIQAVRDTEEYYDFFVPQVQKGQAMLYGESGVEPRGAIVAGSSPGAIQASREKYAILADIGVTNQIGDTPFDTALNLQQASLTGNIPGSRTTALINDIQNEQNQIYSDDPAKVPSTPQEQAADFNSTAIEVMKRHGQNIKSGDTTNPFHAPPLSALEIAFTSLAKDPLYAKVLKPAGITESNPDKIVEQAIAGIQSGTISAEQAVDGISLIYESAIDYNNAFQGGFARVGLPNQGSYLTTLPKPESFFADLIASVTEGIKESPIATAGTLLLAGTVAGATAPVTLTGAVLTTAAAQFLPSLSNEVKINMADFNEDKAYLTASLNTIPLEPNESTGE